MRTDVIIDNKQVNLKNVTLHGYLKGFAKKGFIVGFTEHGDGEQRCGRVLGRIAKVGKIGNDPDMAGWLVIAQMSPSLTTCYERWINPDWVFSCYDPQNYGFDVGMFLNKFINMKLPEANVVRKSMESGSKGVFCPTKQEQTINKGFNDLFDAQRRDEAK